MEIALTGIVHGSVKKWVARPRRNLNRIVCRIWYVLKMDKFQRTDENNTVAPSARGASNRAQVLKDCTVHHQSLDNVGGSTKDDGSSQWQHQQEQQLPQEEDEATLNSR
uniref:Uncharacterized protein n=1 Tax=Anopheles atroparvus TaxID=41427 RepID=A0A182IUG2_ANOAO